MKQRRKSFNYVVVRYPIAFLICSPVIFRHYSILFYFLQRANLIGPSLQKIKIKLWLAQLYRRKKDNICQSIWEQVENLGEYNENPMGTHWELEGNRVGGVLLPVKQQDEILGQEPSPSFKVKALSQTDRQQEACTEGIWCWVMPWVQWRHVSEVCQQQRWLINTLITTVLPKHDKWPASTTSSTATKLTQN